MSFTDTINHLIRSYWQFAQLTINRNPDDACFDLSGDGEINPGSIAEADALVDV